jgi:uncharacterized repeat protein (TIGR02543 family)
MQIEDKVYNGRKTTAKIDGIQFNNINSSAGISKNSIMSRSLNIWRNESDTWYSAINAVDIDWNGAEVEDNVVINTTGELLSWIKTKNNIEDIKINGESKGNTGLIDLGNYLTEHPLKGSKYTSYGSINNDIKRIAIGLSIDKNGHIISGREISIQELAQELSRYITIQNDNIYMISFKDGDEIIINISGISGTSINLPQNPQKEGYEFVGWNTNINAEEGEEVINQIGNENVTYYAIWREVRYKYYYGSDEDVNLSKLNSVGIAINNPLTTLTQTVAPDPSKYIYFIYPKSWGAATILDSDGDGVGLYDFTEFYQYDDIKENYYIYSSSADKSLGAIFNLTYQN